MKFFTILHKDFKLLLRSKSSAFTAFIGPMLIIALILFAFSSSQELNVSIGISGSSQEGVGTDFFTGLEEEGYTLIDYENVDDCIEDLKFSIINLCVNFPENFVSEDDSDKNVEFYVDQSRLNVAQEVIYSVGANIESTSEEITDEKTKEVLGGIGEEVLSISLSQEEAMQILEGEASFAMSEISSSSSDVESDVDSIDSEMGSAVSDSASGVLLVDEMSDSYNTILENAEDILDEVDAITDPSSSLSDAQEALQEALDTEGENITDVLNDLESAMGSLASAVGTMDTSMEGLLSSSESLSSSVSSLQTQIGLVEDELSDIGTSANVIAALSGQDIENKFGISVHEILSSSDKSLFMFPYYLCLLLLFVGMILASNLIVIERQSKAYFRNNTSPTSNLTRFFARFCVTFVVLALQATLVLLAAQFFLHIPVFENIAMTGLILVLSISLFLLLGYLIGYIFKTQEGTNIALLSLGGALTFLSNLILPIESFSYIIREALLYNPYMLSSELLKKSILFQSGIVSLGPEILLLIGYVCLLFILVVVLLKLSGSSWFLSFAKRRLLKRPHILAEGKFRFDDGSEIEYLDELVIVLKRMKDSSMIEYGHFGRNNEFAFWIKDVFKKRWLARKIRKSKSTREMAKAIEEHLVKEIQKNSKK